MGLLGHADSHKLRGRSNKGGNVTVSSESDSELVSESVCVLSVALLRKTVH